jgi:hypothetical protein
VEHKRKNVSIAMAYCKRKGKGNTNYENIQKISRVWSISKKKLTPFVHQNSITPTRGFKQKNKSIQ